MGRRGGRSGVGCLLERLKGLFFLRSEVAEMAGRVAILERAFDAGAGAGGGAAREELGRPGSFGGGSSTNCTHGGGRRRRHKHKHKHRAGREGEARKYLVNTVQ